VPCSTTGAHASILKKPYLIIIIIIIGQTHAREPVPMQWFNVSSSWVASSSNFVFLAPANTQCSGHLLGGRGGKNTQTHKHTHTKTRSFALRSVSPQLARELTSAPPHGSLSRRCPHLIVQPPSWNTGVRRLVAVCFVTPRRWISVPRWAVSN